MQPFTTVTGPAAPLLRDNIDTDLIIPIDSLVGTGREELGRFAFTALRFGPDGSANPDFPLNRQEFHAAPILLSGANFGCGSSREGAVWALQGLGLRCVIAPSFGDIFAGNCFQNGFLPVILAADVIGRLAAAGGPVTVDLSAQQVRGPDGSVFPFAIEALRRTGLLQGFDEIDLTLQQADTIEAFRSDDRARRPWAWLREG